MKEVRKCVWCRKTLALHEGTPVIALVLGRPKKRGDMCEACRTKLELYKRRNGDGKVGVSATIPPA